MQTTKTEAQLESSETGNLIAASKVEGTTVMNTAGEKLGSIENVMIGFSRVFGQDLHGERLVSVIAIDAGAQHRN